MKLVKYQKSNDRVSDDVPKISINGRVGIFILNKLLCERLNLKVGDSICFYQDEDSLIDWFIKKENGNDSFTLRNYKGALCFSCSKIARKMLSSMVGGDKARTTSKFIVSGKPYDSYHAILAGSSKKITS